MYHVLGERGAVTTKAEPYIEDYRWEYSAEGSSLPDGPNDANTFYHWHAVITGVPKYDDLGYEIQYYAVERSSVVRTPSARRRKLMRGINLRSMSGTCRKPRRRNMR